MLFDTLVLFDLSSSFCYGRKSDLVKHGYSRDHRSDRPQIAYGLLCDREGRPVAVEVLPGNTSDPKAFTRLVDRESAQASRKSVVAPAVRSQSARRKDETGRTASGLRVQSFQDLLKDLATLSRHRVQLTSSGAEFPRLTESTALQRHVLELLDVAV